MSGSEVGRRFTSKIRRSASSSSMQAPSRHGLRGERGQPPALLRSRRPAAAPPPRTLPSPGAGTVHGPRLCLCGAESSDDGDDGALALAAALALAEGFLSLPVYPPPPRGPPQKAPSSSAVLLPLCSNLSEVLLS